MSFFQFENSFLQINILPTIRLYEDALSIAIVDSTKNWGLFYRIFYRKAGKRGDYVGVAIVMST